MKSLTSGEANLAWGSFWKNSSTTVDSDDASYLSDLIKFDHIKFILQKHKGSCLEVGCGSGRVSAWMSQLGYDSLCLDNSQVALDLAKKNFSRLGLKGQYILGDARNIPLKTNSVDVVFSTGLLEHFKDPQVIVNEMVRVLKPGGIFFSDIVPSRFSIYRIFNYYKPLDIGGYIIYEGNYSDQDIKNWLKKSGLNDIGVFAAGVMPPIGLINRIPPIKKVSYWLKPVWKLLDGTRVADILGYYYFSYGVK